MATDIVIPTVGESVNEGVIAAWTKGDGEWVERDETVIELETDKITMEIPAPAAGVLKHGAAEGDTVEVGAKVGSIDESAEKPSGGSGSDSASKSKAEGGEDSGGGAATATKDGSGSSESDGTKSKAPEAVEPSTKHRGDIDTGGGSQNGSAGKPSGDSSGGSSGGGSNGDIRATPLARKLADEQRIDLHNVSGTGPGGRVREQDVLAAMQSVGSAASAVVGSIGSGGGGEQGPSRGMTREKMSPMRQRIASRLVDAQQTAAMLTTFNEVDMTAVMATRSQYKEAFGEKHGIGLGFMSFFVKAAASALRAFPMVNAYIVEGEGGKPAIEKHDYQDIAIAVSSPKGLVVPVLRNAEAMSFAGIEAGIKDFAVRAKDGKLGLDEMQGGTFTITNGGIFGSLISTPILNPPQSAILGMHGIKKRAVEHPDKPGEIALRPMMYLALSYDHRIVDGADAVRFLVHIKDAIEDPKRLLLDL